jgi:rRNA maturation endonuclease Nob1
MFDDILEEKEHYHTSSYLKPVYECENCNLSMTTLDDKDTEICPLCGRELKKEYVPLVFTQDFDYATVSC